MATQKPWRTVLTGTSTGRFTREQIRDAMDSVASRSKAARTESDGGASKSAGAAAADNEKPAKTRSGTPD
jgi:hypothetical protein